MCDLVFEQIDSKLKYLIANSSKRRTETMASYNIGGEPHRTKCGENSIV